MNAASAVPTGEFAGWLMSEGPPRTRARYLLVQVGVSPLSFLIAVPPPHDISVPQIHCESFLGAVPMAALYA